MEKFDFCGWATKNDIKCSDGRTIRKDAFKHQDGTTVPLVWNHDHNDPLNVLGHAKLENRQNGVYAYCTFNNTPQGTNAKSLVQHGDVTALSIYANKLKQNRGDVVHGVIRELSLVLAGANPGAYIETVVAHSDDADEEAVIYTGLEIKLAHHDEDGNAFVDADDEDEVVEHADENVTVKDVINSMNEEQKDVMHALVGMALASGNGKNSPKLDDNDSKKVKDVIATMNDNQKNVMYAMVAEALNTKGEEDMSHNAFEQNMEDEGLVLSHAEREELVHSIFAEGPSFGRLSKSIVQHAAEYGIDDIDYLFPDYKNVTDKPQFIQRDIEWVKVVLDGVKKTPFSRIKSLFADITADEARAKGYMKGNLKKEEVFGLLKRTTDATTIYKKQKFDRDDLIDITDFDVLAWVYAEMRTMLNEELARCILFGDGRDTLNPDHVDATKIRPVMSDAALYTINRTVPTTSNANDIVDEAVRAKKGYKGSGNPVAFTTEDFLIDARLLRDTHGYRMYKTISEIADAMGVSKIVTVPVMEGLKGPKGGDLQVVMLNLNDYNVGTNKGGEITTFKDFDIDYNQEKYLIETRCSGALVVPYSAITIETKDGE